ncbi:MAG: VOC family protein [Pseudomonadota bacterium]
MSVPLRRLIIYTRKMDEMVEFYGKHFGFSKIQKDGDRIIELHQNGEGMTLLLHPASKGQKEGQSLVKLVFDVENVHEFSKKTAPEGLVFGKVHKADGYFFANAKDPANNSIQISSRAFGK